MRKEGWETILDKYFVANSDAPFEWGKNDCVLFAAKCAVELLQEDISNKPKLFGEYDKLRAYEIIQEHGGSIAGIFDAHLKRKLKSFATRGDIALVKNQQGEETAGIVSGNYVVCKAKKGLGFVHRDNILVVWGVD